MPYVRLDWTKDMEVAFTNIIRLIADAVALNLPEMSKPFVLLQTVVTSRQGGTHREERKR